MRYRIRTIMLVIAGLAAPIDAGSEGWKVGCLPLIALVWMVLGGAPLGLMIFITSTTSDETVKDHSIAFLGAVAILGYFLAILGSMIGTGVSRGWLR